MRSARKVTNSLFTNSLSERVLFGHPSGCPCCRNLPDDDGSRIGELLLANQSDGPLFAGPAASNQTLADYLRSGFWTDRSSNARKFNLSNSGTYAKNGIIISFWHSRGRGRS